MRTQSNFIVVNPIRKALNIGGAFLRCCLSVCLAMFLSSAQAQLAKSAWPIFHGDLKNTGQSNTGGAVPIQKWSTEMGATSYAAPIIGPDGTIYVICGSAINGVDPATGSIKFSTSIGGTISGNPTLGIDGSMYVGDQYGNFYSLNSKTGTVNWSYKAGRNIATPSIGPDGTVYVGSSDDNFYAFNPTTGALKWSFTALTAFESCPAFGNDGTVYAGTWGGTGIYALNPVDGSKIWSAFLGIGVEGSPSVGADGTLYVGDDGGNLFAVDSSNGSVKWSFKTGWTIVGTPVIASNGMVYISCGDQNIYALNAQTGAKVWSYSANARYYSSPVAAGDATVYVGPADGNVYALNGTSGALLWKYPTAAANSTPAIGADGTLYVVSGTSLIAFEAVNVASLTLAPTLVSAGSSSVGTVTLNGPATTGGALISLSTDNPAVTVPATVMIPVGQTSATFLISTSAVAVQSKVQISAALGTVKTATLTVNAPTLTTISLSPNTVTGGSSTMGTVSLNIPAFASGAIVLLSSDNSAVTVPNSVAIGGGQTTASFTVATVGVNAQVKATITATLNGVSQTVPLTVNPATLVSVSLTPAAVVGGTSSAGTLTLSGPAGLGGTTVSLSSDVKAATVIKSVTVPSGQSSVPFTVNTVAVGSQRTATITATLGTNTQTAQLTVNPPSIVSVTFNPSSVLGGTPTTGTITLNSQAANGGMVVSLSSNDPAATVPPTVTVLAGQKTITFTVTTVGVNKQTVATINATSNGQSQNGPLTITPTALATIGVIPSSVLGGASSTLNIALTGPAATGGTTISLASGNATASLPASVTVPVGLTTTSVTVTTIGVNAQTAVTLTATLNGSSLSTPLTITPASLAGLVINPPSVPGGTSSSGKVTLSGPAGVGGTVVLLSASNSNASVANTVTVPSGQVSATFGIQTVGVSSQTSTTIKASLGKAAPTATLTITPALLQSVSLNPSTVAGGSPSMGTVSLNGLAGPAGVTILLSSNNKTTASVPASVAILPGQGSASFSVVTTAVKAQSQAMISAELNNNIQSAFLTLVPQAVSSVSISPSSVSGGANATGTVTLNGLAPKGGTVVKLSSGSKSATISSSVTVLSGQSSTTFTIKTSAVAAKTLASVTATLGSSSASASLTINPPTLVSVSVNPTQVVGGSAATGTVTLSSPAPTGGLQLNLTSDSAAASVGSMVTVAAGKSSATFAVKSAPVTTQTNVNLTAKTNGISVSTSLAVMPPSVQKLSVSPTSVAHGKTSNGTVTLNGPAPVGGTVVTLASSLSAATVPITITVAAGKTTAPFTIQTGSVSSKSTATITATAGGASKTATLTIT